MKKAKQFIALLLAASMIFSLTACGSKGGDAVTPTKAPAAENQTPTEVPVETPTEDPTEVPAEPEADRYPAFDMGGRTIRIAQWWDRYYDSGDTDVNDNPGVTNVETAQMQLDNLRRIEERYNVKIEFVNVAWGGMIESINTSIAAGNPEFDIYTVDLQFGVGAVANGLALPISQYTTENHDINNENNIMLPLNMLGDNYLFTENGPVSGTVMAYNAEIIRALGLEDPQSLYEKGEWNWDKFAEYCIAATKDTDGDGVNDQYGYGGVYGTSMGFVYANNGTLASGATESLSSPQVVETYNFLDRLYNVDKTAVYFSGTDNDWNANLYGWANGNILFWGAAAWLLKAGADNFGADFEYHVVPFPLGPSGDGSSYGAEARNWYMIPVGTKDADKVYQIFEEYTNWFDGDTSYIYDKTIFEPYFLSEQDIDYSLMTGSKTVVDFAEKVGFDLGSFHNSIITGQTTVSQAVESNKQLLQDKLDAIFKKSE